MSTPANTLHVITLPLAQEGPRHGGGRRMLRGHEVYVNGHLFGYFREGNENAFKWATGQYYDRGLAEYVQNLERVLGCKAIRGRKKEKTPGPLPAGPT